MSEVRVRVSQQPSELVVTSAFESGFAEEVPEMTDMLYDAHWEDQRDVVDCWLQTGLIGDNLML